MAATSEVRIASLHQMPDSSHCRVRFVELFKDGIVVTFTDGKSALFSAEFLHSSLSQAQELTENDEEEPGSYGDPDAAVSRP